MATAKKMLKVKLVRSPIGCNPKHRATIKGLGLKKINQVVELEDSVNVRGMINKVSYLVDLVESK